MPEYDIRDYQESVDLAMNKGAVIKRTPLSLNERVLLFPHRFKGTPFQGYRLGLSYNN